MNALRSFASQVLSNVGQKEASGARERDSGQAETSGRLSDRLPEVVFDESCSAELKLLQIWNKYYSARREKKAEVSGVAVFLHSSPARHRVFGVPNAAAVLPSVAVVMKTCCFALSFAIALLRERCSTRDF